MARWASCKFGQVRDVSRGFAPFRLRGQNGVVHGSSRTRRTSSKTKHQPVLVTCVWRHANSSVVQWLCTLFELLAAIENASACKISPVRFSEYVTKENAYDSPPHVSVVERSILILCSSSCTRLPFTGIKKGSVHSQGLLALWKYIKLSWNSLRSIIKNRSAFYILRLLLYPRGFKYTNTFAFEMAGK